MIDTRTKDELQADEKAADLVRRQVMGSLIATGKSGDPGWNPKATARRRAKNRVAATSRRKNRRR